MLNLQFNFDFLIWIFVYLQFFYVGGYYKWHEMNTHISMDLLNNFDDFSLRE